MPGILRLVLRSTLYYRKQILFQLVIIALLTAVITGSLLTGRSVRESLKRSASERLGKTGILISSGMRYFDKELTGRLEAATGAECTGLLETSGMCQSLNTQKKALNTNIYAIDRDFFSFNGNDSVRVNHGEALINKRLAAYLGVKQGDDIIIRFRKISDIPSDAPFAPGKEEAESMVLKIGTILESSESGNFSLAISQIIPMNVYLNISDISAGTASLTKFNRLLISRENEISLNSVSDALKKILKPSDTGLRLRTVTKTGEPELASDRIFIDEATVSEISRLIPSSSPVITYLANRISAGTRSAPYSFISAIPKSLYPEIPDDGLLINNWLAGDLHAEKGDTVRLFWYSPDSLNNLAERSQNFEIKGIVDMKGIWADSLLMPDFPGISQSVSCSRWDAGIPVRLDEIRATDEDYWKRYRGTPKAFINYDTGKKLWGSNFGPATAIRFASGSSVSQTEAILEGSMDPGVAGLSITDLFGESIKAADGSSDFGTLFLSLGFFLIVAAFVLLSYAVSSFYDARRNNINTLFFLGFRNKAIIKILFIESLIISFTGCIAGAYSGYLVNFVITKALNSVWSGAVQTDTLASYFRMQPILAGFTASMAATAIIMFVKIKRHLKSLKTGIRVLQTPPSRFPNLVLIIVSILASVLLFVLSLVFKERETAFCFGSGTVLLLSMILAWRQFYIRSGSLRNTRNLSRSYYLSNPSHALIPIIFIAAGIFAVFITGANRKDFDEDKLKRTSGTGGYLFWSENVIPVKEDMNSLRGRKELGIDEDTLSAMRFVQMKRTSGNDASCLNLNHITSPPLLGVDPSDFIARGSFSFAARITDNKTANPWSFLAKTGETNIIYGIADQTVLEWGLKLAIGDTLILRSENGSPLNIVIAAGLKSSVFQGYILIGKENFTKYFPSVSGSQVSLIDGDTAHSELYKEVLLERLDNNGIEIENTSDRLASFYEVTNTYLSVFGAFSSLGMIIGIAGLGFILLKTYNQRKRELALLLATGFSFRHIKRMILTEQITILFAGISTGVIPALVATLPSIKFSQDIPWTLLIILISAIIISAAAALAISIRSISADSLIISLRRE